MSIGSMRARAAREDGLSLLELVLAAVIQFIAVTAVFGLIIASTNMSVQAKQQTLTVNAGNSYIEYVRTLPYGSIGVQGNPSIPGSLTPETTLTIGAYNVGIVPEVTWVSDANIGPAAYKRLRVTVTSVAPSLGKPLSRTMETFIRLDTEVQTGSGVQSPVISFVDANSPAPDSVVYGTDVMVQANASQPMVGGLLDRVQFYCDTPILRGVGGGADGLSTAAEWLSLSVQSGIYTFRWDTTSVDTSGATFFYDGTRTVRIVVYDNLNQTSYRTRSVVIDNNPPATPAGTIGVNVRSELLSELSWATAMDGTDPANHYDLNYSCEDTGGFWTLLGQPALTSPSYQAPTTALGRYWASVRSASPRDLSTDVRINCGEPWYSKATVRGVTKTTFAGSGSSRTASTDVTLTASVPSFDTSGTTVYGFYRSLNQSGPWSVLTTVTTNVYARNDLKTVGNSGQPDPFYYKAIVRCWPDGPFMPTGRWVQFETNLVGPISSTAGAIPVVPWP